MIGLTRHAVNDAATALKLLKEGIQRRSPPEAHFWGSCRGLHAAPLGTFFGVFKNGQSLASSIFSVFSNNSSKLQQ